MTCKQNIMELPKPILLFIVAFYVTSSTATAWRSHDHANGELCTSTSGSPIYNISNISSISHCAYTPHPSHLGVIINPRYVILLLSCFLILSPSYPFLPLFLFSPSSAYLLLSAPVRNTSNDRPPSSTGFSIQLI